MIGAQKIMDVADAANSLRLMLDGQSGNLSVIAHPGVSGKRNTIVREVMRKHGLTLPQASKYVK